MTDKVINTTPNQPPAANNSAAVSFPTLTPFTDKDNRAISKYKRKYNKFWSKNPTINPSIFKPNPNEGLTEKQVESRVNDCLTNYTRRGSTKSVFNILFTNLFSFFNLLCFGVAGILTWNILTNSEIDPKTGVPEGGDWGNLLFMLIIIANILIGIIQELRAKYSIERLTLVAASKAKVIRGGRELSLSLDDIVLNDVVVLTNGAQIPADGVILDGVIEVNESLLTGESSAIQKKVGDKVWGGSFVSSGTARYMTKKIGRDNYIAAIAKGASRYSRPKSELLNALNTIIKAVGVVIVILGAVQIMRLIATDKGIIKPGDEFSISKAISNIGGNIIGMIPAGMFLLTSLALAVGVINLAKSNTLVQELFCIEMLARVDLLCLDKTGTITDGTMKVVDVVEINNKTEYTLREIISSMLFALEDNNLTSAALQDYFGHEGIIKHRDILPFSSARKLSAVTFNELGTYVLGAPEFVLKDMSDKTSSQISRFISQGYRVLALGHSKGKINGNELPAEIKPTAIITIQDNIRKDAHQTLKWFRDSGVGIRVISGDNPITVSEVAKRAGVDGADKFISLQGLSPSEVRSAANLYTVFGRVTPEQKLILIKEFKSSGRKVAMTGDGVNDILALKEADCSIAMANGSEAARNVSHLVLMDSSFSSMPKVVEEGRRVVNNVQKSSSLFLFKTFFTILLTVFCIAVNYQSIYLFNPKNLMLLEYLIIGIPCFALALERNNQPIEGKFILNIIKNAFSGAIVVLLNIALLYVFKIANLLYVDDKNFLTLSIYATLYTGFAMLFKMIQPVNTYRGVLIVSMLILFSISIWYMKEFFGIETLGLVEKILDENKVVIDEIIDSTKATVNLLLVIIMAETSFGALQFINNLLSKMKLDMDSNIATERR
ncbi:MAG: HAD-IC family P-type ATPase [Christensenellaceae bacterium]|nr:HAD-IC family P-type ATPase [Christensenellaceae bacterium]